MTDTDIPKLEHSSQEEEEEQSLVRSGLDLKVDIGATALIDRIITLGNQTDSFVIESCNLYESFTITKGGIPTQFVAGHFATAQNDPKISLYPYHYKILLIVEDTTEMDSSKDRVVAICQYYRSAHDSNVKSRRTYPRQELFRTNVLEEVPLDNFIQPALVFEAFPSVPKKSSRTQAFFQYQYFDEENSEVLCSLPDQTYIGQLQLPKFLSNTFNERYKGKSGDSVEELQQRHHETIQQQSPPNEDDDGKGSQDSDMLLITSTCGTSDDNEEVLRNNKSSTNIVGKVNNHIGNNNNVYNNNSINNNNVNSGDSDCQILGDYEYVANSSDDESNSKELRNYRPKRNRPRRTRIPTKRYLERTRGYSALGQEDSSDDVITPRKKLRAASPSHDLKDCFVWISSFNEERRPKMESKQKEAGTTSPTSASCPSTSVASPTTSVDPATPLDSSTLSAPLSPLPSPPSPSNSPPTPLISETSPPLPPPEPPVFASIPDCPLTPVLSQSPPSSPPPSESPSASPSTALLDQTPASSSPPIPTSTTDQPPYPSIPILIHSPPSSSPPSPTIQIPSSPPTQTPSSPPPLAFSSSPSPPSTQASASLPSPPSTLTSTSDSPTTTATTTTTTTTTVAKEWKNWIKNIPKNIKSWSKVDKEYFSENITKWKCQADNLHGWMDQE